MRAPLFFLIAVVAMMPSARCRATQALSKEVEAALDSASSVTLYSLEPWTDPDLKVTRFHGYRVLGKTRLDSEAKMQAIAAIQTAISSFVDPGYVAACFDPRHALHITNAGHSYDILVCYQCMDVQVFRDQQSIAWLGAVGSPDTLNALLSKARVPISKSATR